MTTFLESWGLGGVAATMALAVLLALALHVVLYRGLGALIRRVPAVGVFRGALLRRTQTPTRVLFPLVALYTSVGFLGDELDTNLETGTAETIQEVLIVPLILVGAWLLVRVARAIEDAVLQRYDLEQEDNLQARKVVTQARILRRIVVVGLCVLAVALVLMQFDDLRSIGTSLLASAGIAGIILGFAAQRTLGNLFAGFQIAITQPIRVDDVVIVEGEFGWVEEITLTYVVVRVWDLRRVVLPISYFIEQPFQNWTRTSSNLLGTVFLYLDYRVPVEALRDEHRRFVEASELWDGRACALQLTGADAQAVEVRCLQSASSAPRLFDLRCAVREHMITFVQAHYPEALPRTRAELEPTEGAGTAQQALRAEGGRVGPEGEEADERRP